jgi:hypothetical protein
MQIPVPLIVRKHQRREEGGRRAKGDEREWSNRLFRPCNRSSRAATLTDDCESPASYARMCLPTATTSGSDDYRHHSIHGAPRYHTKRNARQHQCRGSEFNGAKYTTRWELYSIKPTPRRHPADLAVANTSYTTTRYRWAASTTTWCASTDAAATGVEPISYGRDAYEASGAIWPANSAGSATGSNTASTSAGFLASPDADRDARTTSPNSAITWGVGAPYVHREPGGAGGDERVDTRTSPSWAPVASRDGI